MAGDGIVKLRHFIWKDERGLRIVRNNDCCYIVEEICWPVKLERLHSE